MESLPRGRRALTRRTRGGCAGDARGRDFLEKVPPLDPTSKTLKQNMGQSECRSPVLCFCFILFRVMPKGFLGERERTLSSKGSSRSFSVSRDPTSKTLKQNTGQSERRPPVLCFCFILSRVMPKGFRGEGERALFSKGSSRSFSVSRSRSQKICVHARGGVAEDSLHVRAVHVEHFR